MRITGINANICVAFSLSLISGCYESDAVAAQKTNDAASKNVMEIASKPNTAGADGAQDAPTFVITDAERDWLKQAETACKARAFPQFFWIFVHSKAVRNHYTLPMITLSTFGNARKIPKIRYYDFPVGAVDYNYVAKNSEEATDPSKFEYLKLDMNQSQSDTYRVDWVRAEFDGKTEGDDLGNVIRRYGNPGHLLFEASDVCWNLVQDTVEASANINQQ